MLFKDHYQNAPQKIQEVVDSFETAETLAQIAADHSVDDNKGIGNRDLGRLTGRVLVGMLHPKDFVPSLVEKLEIPKERAQKIAKEVNQKIFSQVKDLLIELHGLNPTPQKGTGFTKKEEKIIHHTLSTPQKNSTTEDSGITKHAGGEKSRDSLGISAKSSGETKQKTIISVPQKPVPQAPKETPPKSPNSSESMKAGDKQGSSVTKLTNPFEEKLRQTFVIPPKNHFVHSGHAPKNHFVHSGHAPKNHSEDEGHAPKNSLPLVSEQTPQDSIPKPPTSPSSPEKSLRSLGARPEKSLRSLGTSTEDSSTARKKEEIKNNPYLETIE